MKQTIEFKKTCIMKTYVEEVTDISVTHDYKVLDDTVEGYFDIVGRYKVTRSSVTDEDFMFTVPFTIALSTTIDKDSINLKMKDFEYSVEKDLLHLNMSLDMEYEQIVVEAEEEPEPMEEALEEEESSEEETLEELINEEIEKMNTEEPIVENEEILEENKEEVKMENEDDLNVTLDEEKIDTKKEINNLVSGFNEDKAYYKYKIYIMKEEDTIESIAIKYDISLDTLKDYNDLENIKPGDKIIVPTPNEQ